MDDLRQKYLGLIDAAGDEAALEEVRLAALGKKGEVALEMRELGRMTAGGAAGRRAGAQRAEGRARTRRCRAPRRARRCRARGAARGPNGST